MHCTIANVKHSSVLRLDAAIDADLLKHPNSKVSKHPCTQALPGQLASCALHGLEHRRVREAVAIAAAVQHLPLVTRE